MGICYRATRHWRSHQKIVSCPFSSTSLRQVPILPLPRSHYSVFLPEILICCHRYKNIVPQYSILHYIIEGMAQKARQISGQRMKKLGQNEKNERHSAAKKLLWTLLEEERVYFAKLYGFCCDFVWSRCILNQACPIVSSSFSDDLFLSCIFYLLGIRWLVSRFRKSFLFS